MRRPPRHRGAIATVLVCVMLGLVACGDSETTATTERQVEIRAMGCRVNIAELASGTVVRDGMIVTVAHAVAGAETISVRDRSGVDHDAVLVAIDTDLDLAVLHSAGFDTDAIDIASLQRGDRGEAYGLGTGGAVDWEVARTVTIRMADIYEHGEHERPGYDLEATIQPGDSGAGLFADDGSLGGVLFATSRQSSGRAWATDIAAAEDLLAAATTTPSAAVRRAGCPAPCPHPRCIEVAP